MDVQMIDLAMVEKVVVVLVLASIALMFLTIALTLIVLGVSDFIVKSKEAIWRYQREQKRVSQILSPASPKRLVQAQVSQAIKAGYQEVDEEVAATIADIFNIIKEKETNNR